MTYEINSICPGAEKTFGRLLHIKTVIDLTSLSRATLLRKAGVTFPAPIPLTANGRRVAYVEAQVREWMRDPLGWQPNDTGTLTGSQS